MPRRHHFVLRQRDGHDQRVLRDRTIAGDPVSAVGDEARPEAAVFRFGQFLSEELDLVETLANPAVGWAAREQRAVAAEQADDAAAADIRRFVELHERLRRHSRDDNAAETAVGRRHAAAEGDHRLSFNRAAAGGHRFADKKAGIGALAMDRKVGAVSIVDRQRLRAVRSVSDDAALIENHEMRPRRIGARPPVEQLVEGEALVRTSEGGHVDPFRQHAQGPLDAAEDDQGVLFERTREVLRVLFRLPQRLLPAAPVAHARHGQDGDDQCEFRPLVDARVASLSLASLLAKLRANRGRVFDLD